MATRKTGAKPDGFLAVAESIVPRVTRATQRKFLRPGKGGRWR